MKHLHLLSSRSSLLALTLAGGLVISACQPGANAANDSAASGGEISLESDQQSLSYALGLSLGKQMKADDMDVDLNNFSAGFGHGMGEGDALMTDEQLQTRLEAFREQRTAERQAEITEISEKNKAEGAAWLAANASKDGVQSTESGLQYKILTEGTGAKPAAEDTVSVNYRGTLIDGTEFDSSYSRGEPTEFPVNRVIPGWTEALQLMSVGSKWEVYIPSDLAYGPAGAGASIAPHATLIFEVELLEIKPAG